ncbi:MAG: formyltransferase family protein, partial [Candidatus Omnitrophota bacterium]|nr:formyltransferase family protein [Candidatus Omnitrophota bacterium]
MKIAFIGGGEWGTPVLEAVAKAHKEVLVIDSPSVNGKDKFTGGYLARNILHRQRCMQRAYSFITGGKNIFYQCIWRYRLPVLLTDSLNKREFIDKIKRFRPDVILVASCAEKLGREIVESANLGCINCHPSLLPKYRGTDPFFWVLRNKEMETGVTFHFVRERIDAGDIILQRRLPVEVNDDGHALASKCASLASSMVNDVLERMENGSINAFPQKEEEATYFPAFSGRRSGSLCVKELQEKDGDLWDTYLDNSSGNNFFS